MHHAAVRVFGSVVSSQGVNSAQTLSFGKAAASTQRDGEQHRYTWICERHYAWQPEPLSAPALGVARQLRHGFGNFHCYPGSFRCKPRGPPGATCHRHLTLLPPLHTLRGLGRSGVYRASYGCQPGASSGPTESHPVVGASKPAPTVRDTDPTSEPSATVSAAFSRKPFA